MIPYRDENRAESFPLITSLLILLNIGIFAYSLIVGFEDTVMQYGFIPSKFSFSNLSSYQTILTSMFLHGSWLHLIGNMLFLYIFGDNIEDKLGKVIFIITYLLGGVAAALAQYFFDTTSTIPMIGASGAISTLLSSYIIFFPRVRIKILYFSSNGRIGTSNMTSKFFLIYWLGFQLISSIGSFTSDVQGGTAYFAHLGGFLFGIIVTFVIGRIERFGVRKDRLYEFDQK